MRRPLDFYETPEWQVKALIKRINIEGVVFDHCVGDKAISKFFPGCITNDIDKNREANYHFDATKKWEGFANLSWTITNPPFNWGFEILEQAFKNSNNIAFLLRLSFLEPTYQRTHLLSTNPPKCIIVLPRWSYKQNGNSDTATTAWFIWTKQENINTSNIIIVPKEEKINATQT